MKSMEDTAIEFVHVLSKYASYSLYAERDENTVYYNGKVRCVDPATFWSFFTKDKVYDIIDGVLCDDLGEEFNPDCPVCSFEEWLFCQGAEWEEVKE